MRGLPYEKEKKETHDNPSTPRASLPLEMPHLAPTAQQQNPVQQFPGTKMPTASVWTNGMRR